jgi:flagellar biogenesis protein FliO
LKAWDYIQAIVIIAAVLFGAYYVTRLVAKTGGGGLRKSSGIKFHGSQSLGKDRSVAVVEIGETVYILGVSLQRVELLDKLPKADAALKKEEPTAPPPTFGESFKEELNKRFHRPDKKD